MFVYILKAKQHQSEGWKGRPSPSPSVKMKRYQYSKKDYDGKKIADLQIIWVSLKQERSQQPKTSDLLPQSQQQRNWSYDCFSLTDTKKKTKTFSLRQHIQSLKRSLPQVGRSNSKETSPVMKESSRMYCEGWKAMSMYTHITHSWFIKPKWFFFGEVEWSERQITGWSNTAGSQFHKWLIQVQIKPYLSHQSKPLNHQGRWITSIILLQCSVLLENLESWHSWCMPLDTHHPPAYCCKPSWPYNGKDVDWWQSSH